MGSKRAPENFSRHVAAGLHQIAHLAVADVQGALQAEDQEVVGPGHVAFSLLILHRAAEDTGAYFCALRASV